MKAGKRLMIGGGVMIALSIGIAVYQVFGGVQGSFQGFLFLPGVIFATIGAIKFFRGRKSAGKFERAMEESRQREG